MNYPTALAAKVAAWNKANAEANRLAVVLAQAYEPLVGKKVICNGGSISAIAAKLAPPRATEPGQVDCFSMNSTYRLEFYVKACELHQKSGEDYCGGHYAETCVSVGPVKDGILLSINDPKTDRRTDYSEDEVLRLRDIAEKAEKAFHEADYALSPFGRYDR